MLKIDPWTMFFTVVNVLILFVGLKIFAIKPVKKIIDEREKLINDQFESAKKSQDEALQMKEEYQEKLNAAKEKAEEIVVEARQRAEAEHDKIMADTKIESEQMLNKAKADIQAEKEKAQNEVQTEIAHLAMAAARKIMKAGDSIDAGSN